MKVISVAVPIQGPSSRVPGFAVFRMTDQDIERLQAAQMLIEEHDLSQARREVFEVELEHAEGDVCTPELMMTKDACWLSVQWLQCAGGGEFSSEPMLISDLAAAFEGSEGGDLHLFGDDQSKLWRALSSDPAGRWSNIPIGYQVANHETGEFWDDEPSFVVLTSKTEALQELEAAQNSGPGWKLDTITLNGIEEPSFV